MSSLYVCVREVESVFWLCMLLVREGYLLLGSSAMSVSCECGGRVVDVGCRSGIVSVFVMLSVYSTYIYST